MARRMWVAILLVCAIGWAQEAEKKPAAASGKKAAPSEKAAPKKTAFTPDEIAWGPAPPFIEPGAQLAVLEGNPMGSVGDYTIRVKMPAGYKIAPHWHPKQENVTVISGTLKVGMGRQIRRGQDAKLRGWQFCWSCRQDASLCHGRWRDHDPDSRHGAVRHQLCESVRGSAQQEQEKIKISASGGKRRGVHR